MKKSIVLVLLIIAVTFLSLTMLFNPSGAQHELIIGLSPLGLAHKIRPIKIV